MMGCDSAMYEMMSSARVNCSGLAACCLMDGRMGRNARSHDLAMRTSLFRLTVREGLNLTVEDSAPGTAAKPMGSRMFAGAGPGLFRRSTRCPVAISTQSR